MGAFEFRVRYFCVVDFLSYFPVFGEVFMFPSVKIEGFGLGLYYWEPPNFDMCFGLPFLGALEFRELVFLDGELYLFHFVIFVILFSCLFVL